MKFYKVMVQYPVSPRANPRNHTSLCVVVAMDEKEAERLVRDTPHYFGRIHGLTITELTENVTIIRA